MWLEIFSCCFHTGVKQYPEKMSRCTALSDESISKILAEDTVIDLYDDVTIEPVIDSENTNTAGGGPLDVPSPSPPAEMDDDMPNVIIDVDETMQYTVTPQKKKQDSTIGNMSPIAGPSGLSGICTSRHAKRKLLARMSTPLPTRRAYEISDDSDFDSDLDRDFDSEPGTIESDSDFQPPPHSDSDTEGDSQNPSAIAIQGPTANTTQNRAATSAIVTQESDGSSSPAAQYIYQVKENERRAPDKTYWSRTPLRSTRCSAAQQPPTQYTPGLVTPLARSASTPMDFFNLFLDEEMLNEIVRCVNIYIEEKGPRHARETQTTSKTSICEMRALIGILIQAGAKHDNHRTTQEMFSHQHGAPLYRATMNEQRFNYLLRCLAFDDVRTRKEREPANRFALLFGDLFQKFVENCKKHYTPGDTMTIDEQLLAFRGNCPFRMYIPKKPSKYGIKIIMACDSKTYYMCNAITYQGKNGDTRERPGTLATKATMTLMEPYLDAGRNLTVDNWFTSLPLLKELHARNTTLVGTMRKKGYVPNAMLEKKKDRPVNTSAFLFQENAVLLSYKPKKNKIVLLMSSKHERPEINDKGKPEIIQFYNKTKGGVDVLDQMCAHYSTSRKTRRWPVCMFFGIINIAIVNAFILYKLSGKAISREDRIRRLFMHHLAHDMAKAWAMQRLQNPSLSKSLVATITSCFKVVEIIHQRPPAPGKKRCRLCPWKTASKCKTVCAGCNNNTCPRHYKIYCSSCQE